MFIPVPDIFSIPDPTTRKRGAGENFCSTFFVAINFTKLKITGIEKDLSQLTKN
jgi:hypothetical protein